MSNAVFSRRARCDGHCKAKFNHILARVPCPNMPARACSSKCAPASLLAQVLSGNVLETCSARRVLCASCPAHLNSVQVALHNHKRAYFCTSSSITGNASVCAFRITSRQLLQTHPRAHDSSKKSSVVAQPPCIDQAHPASVLERRHRPLAGSFCHVLQRGLPQSLSRRVAASCARASCLAHAFSRKCARASCLAHVFSRKCARASCLARKLSRTCVLVQVFPSHTQARSRKCVLQVHTCEKARTSVPSLRKTSACRELISAPRYISRAADTSRAASRKMKASRRASSQTQTAGRQTTARFYAPGTATPDTSQNKSVKVSATSPT